MGEEVASQLYLPIKLLYWIIGSVSILVALYYLIAYSSKNIPPPPSMPNGFNGTFNTLIEIPIPFTHYLFPIYPYSAIMLGVFLIALEHRFKWRALPILLMSAGAFDIIEKQAVSVRIFTDTFWLSFQLLLLIGGWLLAGRPTFNPYSYYFVAFFVCLVLFAQTQFYDFYELSLYAFVYKCTVFKN